MLDPYPVGPSSNRKCPMESTTKTHYKGEQSPWPVPSNWCKKRSFWDRPDPLLLFMGTRFPPESPFLPNHEELRRKLLAAYSKNEAHCKTSNYKRDYDASPFGYHMFAHCGKFMSPVEMYQPNLSCDSVQRRTYKGVQLPPELRSELVKRYEGVRRGMMPMMYPRCDTDMKTTSTYHDSYISAHCAKCTRPNSGVHKVPPPTY